jgi:hypothetical protein
MSVSPATRETEEEGLWSKASPGQKYKTLKKKKKTKAKRARDVVQVIELFPSKYKVLNSNNSTTQK